MTGERILIETVQLPDGTIYVAVREGSQLRLYEQDRDTGDYKPVTAPVFGSWGADDAMGGSNCTGLKVISGWLGR